MGVLVSQVMRTDCPVVRRADTVSVAFDDMKSRRLDCLPVVEGGRLVGTVFISDPDEWGKSADALDVRVGTLMTAAPECCSCEDELATALARLSASCRRWLPVVQPGSDAFVGMVSGDRLAGGILEEAFGSMLILPPEPAWLEGSA